MTLSETLLRTACVGIGATAFMDAWLLLRARFGGPAVGFAPVGRWVGHMRHGRFVHAGIAQAAPVAGEQALGWAAHYLVGIAFAAALVGLAGEGWLRAPSPGPALAFGVATVAAPLLVMQPAMGAGLAASKTASPWTQRLRSTANHAVFGLGLYLAAAVVR
jgi:hypothetical protein